MDSLLQISESYHTTFPEYFRKFLDKCIKEFPGTFYSSDYMFAAVYFLILDSGFCPLDMYEKFPEFCTESFDIRKLRNIKFYNLEHVSIWSGKTRVYMAYKIPVRYGRYRCECEIQAVPSADNVNYLIVNMLKKRTRTVKSLCINMKKFLKKNPTSKYKFSFRKMKKLEIMVKDTLCNPIRETIMIEETAGVCPHLLRLPEAIQSQIMYSLTKTPMGVQYLSSTCSYFHNMTKFDSQIWQQVCVAEFKRKRINQVLLELFHRGNNDSTVFKQAYLELKRRKLRKHFIPYKFWYVLVAHAVGGVCTPNRRRTGTHS